jgi:hypothetical protein
MVVPVQAISEGGSTTRKGDHFEHRPGIGVDPQLAVRGRRCVPVDLYGASSKSSRAAAAAFGIAPPVTATLRRAASLLSPHDH